MSFKPKQKAIASMKRTASEAMESRAARIGFSNFLRNSATVPDRWRNQRKARRKENNRSAGAKKQTTTKTKQQERNATQHKRHEERRFSKHWLTKHAGIAELNQTEVLKQIVLNGRSCELTGGGKKKRILA
jgi:hypothetical protein